MEEDAAGNSLGADDDCYDEDNDVELPGKQQVLQFIRTYESYPMLWDPTHEDYFNKYRRNDALDKLLVIYKRIKPDAMRIDVRKKINTIRCNYKKEMNKIEACILAGQRPKPMSWTCRALQFLGKINNYSASEQLEQEYDSSYMTVKTRKKKEKCEEVDEEVDDDVLEDEESNQSFIYISPRSSEAPPQPKKRRTKKIKEEIQEEIDEPECHIVSNPLQPMLGIDGSSIEPIALVWSTKLKKLNDNQRLFAEKAINDVLFEAEMNSLTRHSVQINKPKSPNSSHLKRFVFGPRTVTHHDSRSRASHTNTVFSVRGKSK